MSGFSVGSGEASPRSLVCDLQTWGKTVIHHGWRKGLLQNQPPIWVFCPLKSHKWHGDHPPHDREFLTKCEGKTSQNIPSCPHFRGILHSTLPASSNDAIQKPKPEVRQGVKPPILKIPESAVDEIRKDRVEWIKEEEMN